ncbi:hypothetical protein AWB76_00927 [Caballeronia temeraria]|uniref:Uncharacterized protein n=1 Tax=Caballeronia temeraria TaxID=1777137 RepID=A0A157ZM02_9BURK|nr:hypothetical protein [Caballeronia temeraria]SAK46511.1 hypothetical protein AWB76_00927 [Caballeronia temeraria]
MFGFFEKKATKPWVFTKFEIDERNLNRIEVPEGIEVKQTLDSLFSIRTNWLSDPVTYELYFPPEREDDALMFKLQFGEYIEDTTQWQAISPSQGTW